MADGEPTGLGEVSVSASMLPAAQQVSAEEEEKDEAAESGHTDDEEDMDDINHAALPKEAVRPNTPTSRPQKADIWNHVRRIAKHDVPDRAMKIDCTHVCVYPLEEGENGEKRYCNTPLKLFRASKAKDAAWSTSAALGHFKKNHEGSSAARKQQQCLLKRQARKGQAMHASASDNKLSACSKKSPYGFSENEKVLSAIARWGTYASMKVSQAAFVDPLFVAMLQAARGPHETKGVVPKLSKRALKCFMLAEFQVTSPCSISFVLFLMTTY